jgi:DNA-binding NarL/FixJ family response regulator
LTIQNNSVTDFAPPVAPAALRVFIVARQPVVRAGLRGLVGEMADVRAIGASASGDEAALLAVEGRLDVVLAAWDGSDGETNLALAEALTECGIPLVFLGDGMSPADLGPAIQAGARGFLLGEAVVEEVEAALRAAWRGLLVVTPVLGRALPALPTVGALVGAPPADSVNSPLTEREQEVLELLALGLPNKTIARRLNVSDHTVKFHVGSILAKLDASSRTEAVTRAARRGLLAL